LLSGAAVDAGWLRQLETWNNEDFFEATDFLHEFNVRRIPLLLDSEGRILREYETVLLRRSLGRRFFEQAMKIGNFVIGSGKALARCNECLDEHGFDRTDRPYIGVAQRFGGIYLTHETKHLTGKIFLAAPMECGVAICDLIAARGMLLEDPS
jgi:hypothetical protein